MTQHIILKKGLVIGIILLFVGTVIIPSNANKVVEKQPQPTSNGNTLYVGGSGPENYTRIQDAINNAIDGDTIIVFSGTYYEAININKQLFLKGTILNGEGNPIINGGDGSTSVTISVNNCSFENFSVRNGDAGFLQTGILLIANNSIVDNCTIYHTGWGISLSYSSHDAISQNTFYNGGVIAIALTSSCNNTIFDNDCQGYDNEEVLFSGVSNNNLLYHNYIHNHAVNPAIKIQNSYNNILEKNNISNNFEGLIIESSRNSTIVNNTFYNDGIIVSGTLEELCSYIIEDNLVNGRPLLYYTNSNGITVPTNAGQIILVNCSDFLIQNCNFSGAEHGIVLINSSNNRIINNTITSAGPYDIELSGSHKNLISGNYVDGGRGGITLSSSNGNIISENIVMNIDRSIAGISLSSYSSENLIISNYVSNCNFGIGVSGPNDTITDNTVENCWTGMEIGGLKNITVTKNIVIHCTNIAVDLEGFWDSTFFDNNISDSETGIDLESSVSCHISRNVITKNHVGIEINQCINLDVSSNEIKNNSEGVFLSESIGVRIEKNNFVFNLRDARFSNRFLGEIINTNKWRENYWGSLPLKLKIILGMAVIEITLSPYPPIYTYITIPLPWFNCDWHPAQKPYDIPGMS